MKHYYVYRGNKPTRILCTDGIIRKNLRHAPEGVDFMRFYQNSPPTREQFDAIVCKCQLKPDNAFGPLLLSPDDWINPRSGGLHRNFLKFKRDVNTLSDM